MPDLQLELRHAMTEPSLLCFKQESFDEIINAKDVTNLDLLERLHRQLDVLKRIITSDNYMQRDAVAFQMARKRKITSGQCREVTHGDLVAADWMEWQSSKDAEPVKPQRLQVSF